MRMERRAGLFDWPRGRATMPHRGSLRGGSGHRQRGGVAYGRLRGTRRRLLAARRLAVGSRARQAVQSVVGLLVQQRQPSRRSHAAGHQFVNMTFL